MPLTAIAREPEGAAYIIVNEAAADDDGHYPPVTPACVLDMETEQLNDPVKLGSLLAHNPYFTDYDPGPGETQSLLAHVGAQNASIGEPRDVRADPSADEGG